MQNRIHNTTSDSDKNLVFVAFMVMVMMIVGVYLGSKEECVLVLRSSMNVSQGVSLWKIHHYHRPHQNHHHHQYSM